MKELVPYISGAAAVITLLAAGINSWLFWRIRAAQLESEARVLEKVEQRFVLKEACTYHLAPVPRHAA